LRREGLGVVTAVNQDDRDGILRQVLLEGKVLINRNKDVEIILSQSEEFAVGDAGPSHTQDSLRIKARNVGCKTSIDSLVK
jgi:hypothetical protein